MVIVIIKGFFLISWIYSYLTFPNKFENSKLYKFFLYYIHVFLFWKKKKNFFWKKKKKKKKKHLSSRILCQMVHFKNVLFI